MTSRTAILPLVVIVLAALGGDADARRNRQFGGRRYVANGTFGLGLELGAPFGLNGKYFLTDTTALNFGIGADGYVQRDRDGLHLYLDHLWHPLSLANPPEFQLPLYIGIGGRLWSFDDAGDDDDGFAFGIRVPIGVAFDFNNVPLDLFVQITPTLDFYRGYADNVGFWLDFSLGGRYWF